MIPKMIWRNLWRNRRRTLITMASVMFALLLCVVMKSLQDGVFDNLVKNVVTFYSGYIQIHKNGYWDERILDNSFPKSDSLEKILLKENFITEAVPRIESFALSSSGSSTFGCMVTGTIPEREDRLTHLKSKIVSGNYLNASDKSALVAEGLAKKLNISVNDTLILLGQGYQGNMAAGKYPVKGIARFGSPQLNESSVYLALPVAQQWLSAENLLTSISLGLDDPKNLEEKVIRLKKILSTEYEVMSWEEMMPEIENHIRADGASAYILMGILYMITAFGIFGTILMMTNERRYEFGMLVAIGMKKIRLAWMLVGESVLISLLGTLAGGLITLPVVLYLEKFPLRFGGEMAEVYERFGFEPIFPAAVDAKIFLAQAIVILIIALLVGLYPLYFVKKLDVLKAMRK